MNRDPLHAAVQRAAAPEPRLILVGPEPLTELLVWHQASELPDAEITVLLRITSPLGPTDWRECVMGYWSGERWCLADDSQIVSGATVDMWSEPIGPDA